MNIHRLPETTVNRIAAGEVIERPAAAVKELVENALDAGARRIAVALDDGGIARIEVVDDGAGIAADELALAVERHATSKLQADDDLVRIATLGFRGEALPSIGAAARLAIVSRTGDATHATAIRVEGGRVSEVAPAAGPKGTRVTVTDLFYATPARRKFLKNPRTEAEHAEIAVARLALAWPGVAFSLAVDGRARFELPAQERLLRAAAILEQDPAELLTVNATRGAMRLSGYAAPPASARASAAGQHLVVNGRPVADPVLRTAVRVAYRDVMVPGRQPVVALFLDLPAEDVDVNVHPAKTELRFRDAAGVRSLVIGALREALAVPAHAATPPRPSLRLVYPSPSVAAPAAPPGSAHGALADAQAPLGLGAAPAARMLPAPVPSPAHPLGAPVAQVLDTYVLAVAADGALVLVDQHAAHERLTHEVLAGQLAAGGVRAQPLLLPAVVEMPLAASARLLAVADELARLGLEIESFGGALLVRAMPAALGNPDPAPLLRDIADELAEQEESTALAARLDAVVARMACHGSIRAGRRLAPAEMDALLRALEATPRAGTCSHGRPTVLRLAKADLERMFGRR